jgi:hypothetical protein
LARERENMNVRKLMAAGTVTAAVFTGIGLAAAASAGSSPAGGTAAQRPIATAIVDSQGVAPQWFTDIVNDVGEVATDAIEVVESAGGLQQAPPVPAHRGVVPADAQFNAG